MGPRIDPSIVAKVEEIRAQPYANYITAEDVIERNFGYKIVRQQVSAGRNSMIYKCETRKYPELFCIVKAYRLGKDKVKASFREEVCQIMRFVGGKCPQIVSFVDMFYTSEKIYLMCDWSSKGEVLANMKAKTFKLNERMLRDWAIDVLSAINFLHSNAICHRNLAPSCLLLTAENRVKIGSLSDAVVYSKPDGYLIKQKWPKFSRLINWNQPPEVAKSKPYDPRRADIWSIGATFYWFITKNHPIDYRSSSRLTKQLETRLNAMTKVSNRCQSFVRKMLTYQPPARPTIAQAMMLEWITTDASAPAPTKEVEIETEKITEPGEAVGPEEQAQQIQAQPVQAPETSTSNRPKPEAGSPTDENSTPPEA